MIKCKFFLDDLPARLLAVPQSRTSPLLTPSSSKRQIIRQLCLFSLSLSGRTSIDTKQGLLNRKHHYRQDRAHSFKDKSAQNSNCSDRSGTESSQIPPFAYLLIPLGPILSCTLSRTSSTSFSRFLSGTRTHLLSPPNLRPSLQQIANWPILTTPALNTDQSLIGASRPTTTTTTTPITSPTNSATSGDHNDAKTMPAPITISRTPSDVDSFGTPRNSLGLSSGNQMNGLTTFIGASSGSFREAIAASFGKEASE